MQTCLLVNDDLHKTFDRYNALKDGRVPAPFVPGESTQQNLLTPTHTYVEQSKGSSTDAAANAAPGTSSTGQKADKGPAPLQEDLVDLFGAS